MPELPPIRPWRAIVRGLRAMSRPSEEDRDASDEVRHWLDEAEADLVARGVSPQEARRAVRARYGDGTAARDDVRSFGWEHVLEAAITDVRYALRRLRRAPAFTTVAVLTLGLGIGAATSIFSVVAPVLFEPLSYPQAHRLVEITDRSSDGTPIQVTFGTYREVLERNRSLSAVTVTREWRPTLTGAGDPEVLYGQRVTSGFFEVLGVAPALGRGFAANEDEAGAPEVAVIADGLWRDRFGADREIVGRPIRLDGRPFTVVGVMPRGFDNVAAPGARVWTPLRYDATLPSFESREWGHHLSMLGRVATGRTVDEASLDLDRIAADPVPDRPRPAWASMDQGLDVRSLRESATAAPRPVMTALLGAVGLLLVIACVNVTNLVLARGVRRRDELAMRVALGAGRIRLARQLLTESAVLAVAGGAAGLGVAVVGVGALSAAMPAELAGIGDIGLNSRAFAFALGVTTAVGVVVGLLPAVASARALQGRSSGYARSSGAQRGTRRALVVAQVALALILLVGAGLLQRSLQQLFAVEAGFDAHGVAILQVQTAGPRFGDDAAVHRYYDEVLEAVRRVPGVAAAALTSQMPLSGEVDSYGVGVEGAPRPDGDWGAYRYTVSPGYLEAMGVELRRGRALDDRDVAGAEPVVLLSESFASRLFGGADPIGRRVHVGRTDLPPHTVVGVVADVKQASLSSSLMDATYVSPPQWYFADAVRWLVVRADADAAALLPELRRAVWSVDADQPIVFADALEALVDASEARRVFARRILDAFAALALLLAGVGLYGVLAGSVGERAREMGVRAALGASRASLQGMVIRQGLSMAGLGVALGLVGTAVGTRVLASMLFGVSRLDPLTYASVLALVGLVATLACWLPAARAARSDPLVALRSD